MKKLYYFFFLMTTVFAFGQSNYLVENFNYTADDLLTDHGWYEHSGTGTNIITVNNGGLSFTGYIGSGVGNAALVDNTGSDENKPLGAWISTGSVYASFLVKANAEVTSGNSGYFFHLGYYGNQTTPDYASLSSSFRARTFITVGSDAAHFKLGLSFNSSTVPSTDGVDITGDLDITQTYLVVIKYTFVDGADNDTASMFVFTDGDNLSSEPVTPTIGPLAGTASDAPAIQAVALRQFNAAENVLVDGIFVRTEWNLVDAGTTLATKQNQIEGFSFSPNPSALGYVNISSKSQSVMNVNVFDVTGKQVINTKVINKRLDVSNLNAGIYVMKVSQDDAISVKKLVIQ